MTTAAMASASVARDRGEWPHAQELFLLAMQAAPTPADRANAAAWCGLAMLAQGDAAGWRLFEQRFGAADQGHFAPRDENYWCGDATESLLIWAEGGRGNVIQFSRYVADVAGRFVLPISFAVHPEMVDLARAHLVNEDVTVLPISPALDRTSFSAHCSMLSLPAIFGFKGWPDPKIPPLQRAPRKRLPLRVGLNWSGAPSYWDDARRSFKAYPFAPLEVLIPKVALVELQPAPAVVEAPALLAPAFIRETLGELENLDLVISTDTAMAHLSAHLGIPTWLLLHGACNWRWAAPGGAAVTGPLRYDAIRFFRQRAMRDVDPTDAWREVLADVEIALRAEVTR